MPSLSLDNLGIQLYFCFITIYINILFILYYMMNHFPFYLFIYFVNFNYYIYYKKNPKHQTFKPNSILFITEFCKFMI